jgi:hemolysin III
MVKANPSVLQVLCKLDHSAINLLISGTYTPFCALVFDGFWKWGMLTIIWTLALIGIIFQIFIIHAPRWLNAGIYIVMGWLCIAAIGDAARVAALGADLAADWRFTPALFRWIEVS